MDAECTGVEEDSSSIRGGVFFLLVSVILLACSLPARSSRSEVALRSFCFFGKKNFKNELGDAAEICFDKSHLLSGIDPENSSLRQLRCEK